jgi:hypothetical protein
MTTFSAWLTAQRDRTDEVGFASRFWRDLPDRPRMSSPASIEGHLRQRGCFDAEQGLAQAWDSTMSEYRQQRIITSAADAGVTLVPNSPGAVVAAAAEAGRQAAAAVTAHVSLASLDAKLDAICAHLGIAVPVADGPVPLDWQAIWDGAQAVAE